MKTASTRDIIEHLQAYEKIHGIGSVRGIGSVCYGGRDVEYVFYIDGKNNKETVVKIPTVEDKEIFKLK